MKENELMIGDWVSCNGFQKQIDFIDLQSIFFDQDIAEPIPITEKTLKANGFEVCSVNEFISTEQGITITIRKNYTIFSYARNYLHIKTFVHELQHALRLCGLSELADNFKIE